MKTAQYIKGKDLCAAGRAVFTNNKNIYDDPTGYWQHDEDHRVYIIIDLKSFYASVECVERGLDPMTTKLVVADPERGEGTICLAISPAMKALGVKNRCRVYQIPKTIDYIMAPPQMAHYEECSAHIYGVYLQYFAKEDIHVYSCDEAFIDVTAYLDYYQMTPKMLGIEIMNAILDRTGIRSSCGIGTNLYLAKIALDITAKHSPDFIGILDEDRFRATLWDHRPITDFWMIARGISGRLASLGIYTMHDICRTAMTCDDILYKTFGVDAEILIDHAFGKEPTRMRHIKSYRPQGRSMSLGQVLLRDYAYEEARIVIKEMADQLCLQMTEQDMVTDHISFFVSYSMSFTDADGLPAETSGGCIRAQHATSSDEVWKKLVEERYETAVRRDAPIRRIGLCAVVRRKSDVTWQYSLFDDAGNFIGDTENACGAEGVSAGGTGRWHFFSEKTQQAYVREEKNRMLQKSVAELKVRYGKNAVLKGMNLEAAGTMRERNRQIGGHKAGQVPHAG